MTMGTAFKRGPDYGALDGIIAGLRESIVNEVKAAVIDLYRPPQITVNPATVEAPDVTVTPTINVPAQDLAVTVTIPGIDRLATELSALRQFLAQPIRTSVTRGRDGAITETTQTRG